MLFFMCWGSQISMYNLVSCVVQSTLNEPVLNHDIDVLCEFSVIVCHLCLWITGTSWADFCMHWITCLMHVSTQQSPYFCLFLWSQIYVTQDRGQVDSLYLHILVKLVMHFWKVWFAFLFETLFAFLVCLVRFFSSSSEATLSDSTTNPTCLNLCLYRLRLYHLYLSPPLGENIYMSGFRFWKQCRKLHEIGAVSVL